MRKRGDLRFSGRLVLGAGLFLALFILPRIVFADGKHYPERAYKVPPNIPSQRAILVYKDGIEKLIIESALEGKGKEFGWIIPLPSKPIEFEKASPGLIKTLSLAVQPKITHDLREERKFMFFISGLVTLWFLIVLAANPKNPVIILFGIFAFAFLYWGIFGSALHKIGGGIGFVDVKGVLVQDIQEVGSYELAVLEANSPDALDNWLQANGFTGLNDEDRTIVSEYIKDGWCFVAAKLKRDTDGYSQPHPLAMSFVADRPVYPLQLTSTVGSDVYLEIFVISYKQATCDRLTLEFSDEYYFKKKVYTNRFRTEDRYLPGFVANSYYQRIGHPEAQKLLWDGCDLSKLSGTLKPYQMKKDIYFTLKESKPYQKHYWSAQGARQTATNASLITWILGVLTLTAVFYRELNNHRLRLTFNYIIAPSLLLSVLLWIMIFAVLPKVTTVSGRGSLRSEILGMQSFRMKQIFTEIIGEKHDYFKGMSENGVRELIKGYFSDDLDDNELIKEIITDMKNPYTVGLMKYEDSPGNYVIFEDERGIIWRTYSREGFPEDFILVDKNGETRDIH